MVATGIAVGGAIMISTAALSGRKAMVPVPGTEWIIETTVVTTGIIATIGIITATGIAASRPAGKPRMQCPGLSKPEAGTGTAARSMGEGRQVTEAAWRFAGA